MPSDALAMLREWETTGTKVGFGHFKVKNGAAMSS